MHRLLKLTGKDTGVTILIRPEGVAAILQDDEENHTVRGTKILLIGHSNIITVAESVAEISSQVLAWGTHHGQ